MFQKEEKKILPSGSWKKPKENRKWEFIVGGRGGWGKMYEAIPERHYTNTGVSVSLHPLSPIL